MIHYTGLENEAVEKEHAWLMAAGIVRGFGLVDSRKCAFVGTFDSLEGLNDLPSCRWLVAMVTGITCFARLLLCFIPPVIELLHQNRTHSYTEACAGILEYIFIHGSIWQY